MAGILSRLGLVLIADLLVFNGAIFLLLRFNWPSAPIVAAAIGTIGMGTFFGFYTTSNEMRLALAAALVVMYMAFLSSVLFISGFRSDLDAEFAQQLVNTFTGMVTTVVSFYLGADAALTAFRIWDQSPRRGP